MKEENESLKKENSKLNEIVNNMDTRLKTTSIMVEKIYDMLRNKGVTAGDELKDSSSDLDREQFESLFSFPISDTITLNKFNKEVEKNNGV